MLLAISCSGHDGTAGIFLWRGGTNWAAAGAASAVGPSWAFLAAAVRVLEFFRDFHPALAA